MRRGAYAAGVFTASAFFLPAALAPGPITLAHGAATALALWLGFAVWRGHGRRDLPSSLPLRIFPVALGLTLSAATVFLAVIAGAWAEPGGPLLALVALLRSWWLFPASPVAMFTAAEPGLPPISEASARLATLAATSALFAGIVFGFLTLIGAVSERESLHDHASIWKDGRAPDSAARLSDRGARGLRPVSDPLSTARRTPVSGRLWLRSLSLLVAFFCLLYAPVFARLVGGAQIPQVDAAFSASPLGGPFVTLWLIGLWGTCLSSALIFSAAYLRLGFALAR
ncbi:MAG: hypothetical protein ACE37J_18755 [Pikeienuella sp.]|uniref:hypothetical protein n=1 Tax=Pikeienuella sp. TaxID=2831957 RepID=UPI003918B241